MIKLRDAGHDYVQQENLLHPLAKPVLQIAAQQMIVHDRKWPITAFVELAPPGRVRYAENDPKRSLENAL